MNRQNVLFSALLFLTFSPSLYARETHSSYQGANACEAAAIQLTDSFYGANRNYHGVAKAGDLASDSSTPNTYVITLPWGKTSDECSVQPVVETELQADGSCKANFLFDQMDPVNNTPYHVAGVDCG